jgi:hypothetical protein
MQQGHTHQKTTPQWGSKQKADQQIREEQIDTQLRPDDFPVVEQGSGSSGRQATHQKFLTQHRS